MARRECVDVAATRDPETFTTGGKKIGDVGAVLLQGGGGRRKSYPFGLMFVFKCSC